MLRKKIECQGFCVRGCRAIGVGRPGTKCESVEVVGGAFMQANYPIGPIAGTAFNLTTMSYRGWMFLGLVVDTAAVHEPHMLLDDLERAYAELLHAGGITSPHLELDV